MISSSVIENVKIRGFAVMIIIFSIGNISETHLNPIVTISFAALKHFPGKNVPVYIGAQVLASVSAAFALKALFHPYMSGGVTVPSMGDMGFPLNLYSVDTAAHFSLARTHPNQLVLAFLISHFYCADRFTLKLGLVTIVCDTSRNFVNNSVNGGLTKKIGNQNSEAADDNFASL
ncbi:glycerol uptake facilitator protein-like [Glycine max]|uniref:glycerol uptake facilitator protein-like n=1 Tax=Glycine max TaxID=3847 RepID=UPI001B354B11|nr:glycerol uptake facilitator protein-like [Glycine max]